jgi:ketosteroid isomerase-like protein
MNQQSADTRQQLLDLGQRWAEAERYGDVAALDALIRDDFVAVGPLGFVLDKQQWLGARRSGALKSTSFEWEASNVRVFGDTAVVVGIQTQESTYEGRDASGRFRVTQIAVRSDTDGRWTLAGMHLSPIAQPPPG